jgi:uncharacterized protein (TIGR03435 family)
MRKSPNPPADDTLSMSVTNGPEGWGLHTTPFGITISKLVQYLNNNFVFDRMVIDDTELDGYHDINMLIKPAADATGNLPDAEMFITALESQLGLTLQKETAPVKTLIVDHIETTPTPNCLTLRNWRPRHRSRCQAPAAPYLPTPG